MKKEADACKAKRVKGIDLKSVQAVPECASINTERYIKIYLDSISKLKKVSSTIPILCELLKRMPYPDEPEIVLLSPTKRDIADVCGVTLGHVNNSINRLIKEDVLIRSYNTADGKINRAVFYFNPYLFAKGNEEGIKKLRESFVVDKNGNKAISRPKVKSMLTRRRDKKS
jgi:hypothetical protein